jgi:hypothetical protein
MARLTIYAPDDQAKMASAFRAAMAKMAVIGQNTAKLIDCSDVIPVPKPVVGKPHLPAGKSMKDIEQAVSPTFLEPKAYILKSSNRSAQLRLSPPSPRIRVGFPFSCTGIQYLI